jgi:hypothetical protein
MPIARQRVAKHIPAKSNARNNMTSIARQRRGKQTLFSVLSVQSGYKRVEFRSWQLLWKNGDRRMKPRERERTRMERVLGSHLLWAL